MREILFRGKDNVSGEWISGYLVNEHHIGDWLKSVPVHPETVGQFTGLTDKNGKKIFEGDIVLWCGIKGIVVWEGHKFVIKGNLLWDFSDDDCIEVIGNIHDNPEMIGGADSESD